MAALESSEASSLLQPSANVRLDQPKLEAGVQLNFCGYEECSPACVWAEVS
jgi:hypothetical protein